MKKEAKKLQRQLFYQVLQKLKSQKRRTEDLSKMLGVGKTALYARINGTKPLPLDELLLLVKTFDLSLEEQIALASSSIPLEFPSLNKRVTSGKEFVQNLLKRLEKISLLEGINTRYITSEIPVFYLFRFKELSLFKLFIYEKTIWENLELTSKRFSFESRDDPDYAYLFRRVHEIYVNMPSSEIWSSYLVDSTLSQLQYYTQSRAFEYIKQAMLICDQLEELLRELMLFAERGQKHNQDGDPGGTFSLFHNEILRTNNMILVNSANEQLLFSTYDDPNYFFSDNKRLWDYTSDWFEILQRRSHPISNNSERNRLALFNYCFSRIDKTRQFINSLDY